MFKSAYYQVVNFIQDLPAGLMAAIWLILFGLTLLCFMKFFKAHDGKQKKFEKGGLFILGIILFALLIFLTYIRR